MANDEFKITILPNGDLKIETDEISPANHLQADKVMDFLKGKFGDVQVQKKKLGHAHHHEHEHDKVKQ